MTEIPSCRLLQIVETVLRYQRPPVSIFDPLRAKTITSISPPAPPVVEGTWETIRTGHILVSLGDNRVIDWQSEFNQYKIWNYDCSD